MKIIVAHPHAAAELGSKLGDAVEAPGPVARRLIADGFDRPAPAPKKSRSTPTADTGADPEGA